jgi:hypothetical protein
MLRLQACAAEFLVGRVSEVDGEMHDTSFLVHHVFQLQKARRPTADLAFRRSKSPFDLICLQLLSPRDGCKLCAAIVYLSIFLQLPRQFLFILCLRQKFPALGPD